MKELCPAKYHPGNNAPHIHACRFLDGHIASHQCHCSFVWAGVDTTWPAFGKQTGKIRGYRTIVNIIIDDGKRTRIPRLEDECNQWDHGAENLRRLGYRKALAGAVLRRLMSGE